MSNWVLEVDRVEHGRTRLIEERSAELGDAQIRLRIDRFALTANNITYAKAGDMLGYWDFFPTGDPDWGRVPAMGWADVVESNHPDIEVGGRYYGWFPMAQEVVFTATPTPSGFRDDGSHRQAHAEVYRGYTLTDRDPWYAPGTEAEDRHALLRGLFLTGFLAEAFFADDDYRGAQQVVVMSASSKTAIGFAQRASERPEIDVVGVTSAGNTDFVKSLGYYDQVVTYDGLDALAVVPSVCIDMAGNGAALAQVHQRLGDQLAHSMMVGMSHHDAGPAEITRGPAPEMFFAPTEVARRLETWGRSEYDERTSDALTSFVTGSEKWMSIEPARGPEGAEAAWAKVFAGEIAPSSGCVVSLHAEP